MNRDEYQAIVNDNIDDILRAIEVAQTPDEVRKLRTQLINVEAEAQKTLRWYDEVTKGDDNG